MYAALGLSGVVFVVHGLVLHGYELQNQRMALDSMMWMAGFNLFGVVVYALRLPERKYPFKYDIFGQSHQIFHFMVVFAALAHTVGMLRAFDYTHRVDHVCIDQ